MTRPQSLASAALVLATLVGGVLVVSCGGAGSGGAQSDTAAVAEWTPEEKIAEGARLAGIGGCNDCHTPGYLYGAPDMARTLSGSDIGWVTPLGTAYPSNLTPDSATGLGTWSEEQLATTLRTGHRPDGTPLLPPMPWQNLANLSDKEMGALIAYLKSLPPVTHAKLATLPPGAAAKGATIVIPPPPAWDAPKAPATP